MDRRSADESTHVDSPVNTSFVHVTARILRPFLTVALEAMREPTPALYALVLIVSGLEPTLIRPYWRRADAERALAAAMEGLIRFPDAPSSSYYAAAHIKGGWDDFVQACLGIPIGMLATIDDDQEDIEIPVPLYHARALGHLATKWPKITWADPGDWAALEASVKHLHKAVAIADALHARDEQQEVAQ